MAGRGGRGAALEDLFKAEARRPGDDDPPPVRTGGRGAVIFAHQHSDQAPAVGRAGRGVIGHDVDEPLPQVGGRGIALRSQSTETPGSSQDSAPRPVGRGAILGGGRGAIIANLEITPSQVGSTYQRGAPSEITAVTSALEDASITPSTSSSSSEPVYFEGKDGVSCLVNVNYIPLELEKDMGYFEYEVRFDPQIDANHLRYKILKQQQELIGRVKSFDGVVLYLPIKLPEKVYHLPSENPNDQSRVTCIIKYKKSHKISESLHFYNVLFNKVLAKLGLVRFGRNYYNHTLKTVIQKHGLEVWPGYVTTVGDYERGVYMNIDCSHRVLRTPTVYENMRYLIEQYGSEWKTQFQKELIGFSVITRYNNVVYKVDDIDFDIKPSSTFPRHDGTEISYFDYYRQQYEITIKDPNQPMLISRKRKQDLQRGEKADQLVCLVPELCCETGLSESQRNNFTLMKDLAVTTKPSPEQRQLQYEKFVAGIEGNEAAIAPLRDWGLKLAKTTLRLPARVIPPEDIYFGKGRSEKGSLNADWGRAATSNPLLMPMNIDRWAILYTRKDEGPVRTFEENMMKSTRQMNISLSNPMKYLLQNDRTEQYLEKLREIIGGLQIVVIVFPSLRADKYSAVKKLCCSEQPIASQVFLGKTLSRPDKARSIVQKIALQMNCKMGGSLWSVKIPTPKDAKLMICGMDTYHEGAQKANSVSAFVASMNDDLTRWYSRVAMQNKGQEIIDELKAMFASALKQFHRVNGKFPDRIMIYRDGVGDGAMKLIKDYEIEQITGVFKSIGADYNPKFTFIVVQKRINTRVFLVKNRSLENPTPGTIVDHTITRKNLKDFFLVPQMVRQGTVSPTHYVILHDSENSQLKPDMAQKITYKLCHLYYNWPGTIRVPAPCQYAHKLAYLIGQSVRKPHAEVLSDKLFYL